MKKMIPALVAVTVFAVVSGCTTYYQGPPPSRPYSTQPYRTHPYKPGPPAPPVVTVSQPDYLILVPGLSVYFVPNASAEIFFYQERWYYRLGSKWYWGRSYRGPWTYTEVRVIPRPLRQLPRDYRARYRAKYYRVPYGHWKKRRQEPPPRARYKQPPYMYRDPNLNVYIVPGISVEIVFYNGRWYNRYQGVWYTGPNYTGPWAYIEESRLPRKLWELGPDYRKDARRYERVPYGTWRRPGKTEQKQRVEREKPHSEDRRAAVPRKLYGEKEPQLRAHAPPVAPVLRGEGPRAEEPRAEKPGAGPEKKPFLERKAEMSRKRLPAQPETPAAVAPPPAAIHKPAKRQPGTLPGFELQRPDRVHYMEHRKIYYIPGISRDIIYFKGSWYTRHQRAWYLGGSFKGPWNLIRGKKIPGTLIALPNNFRDRPFENVPYGHWKNEKRSKGKRK